MQRKAQHSLIAVVRHRKSRRQISVLLPVIGLGVQRNEVYRRADIARGQLLYESRAVDAERSRSETQHVQMPGMVNFRPLGGQLQRLDTAKSIAVGLDNLPAPQLELPQLSQLSQPHRGLHVRHVVLESRLLDAVGPAAAGSITLPSLPAHPMQSEGSDASQ